MKFLVIALIMVLSISCSDQAPKDSDGNLSSYETIGKFKGNTIYRVEREYEMSLYIAIKDVDSSVSSMSTKQGKTNVDMIIINNDTLSKTEALERLSK